MGHICPKLVQLPMVSYHKERNLSNYGQYYKSVLRLNKNKENLG